MNISENIDHEQLSESTVVAQAQQGDAEAFQLLYHRYKSYVSGQCRRLGCDAGLTEDLTQDVFIQLWEKLSDFKGRSAFRTWLHRIAVNIVFRHFRKNKRNLLRVELTSPSGESIDLADQVYGNPRSLDDRIFISQVLSGLSSTDRKLVMLHTAGFKHREIARLLQISGSTSRSQLFRARAKIQKQYFGPEQLPADIAA
jgi:RNA polymerase sigma-70 factor, ECF subfamily